MVTRRNDYLTLLTYLDRCVRAPDHDLGMDAAELVDHAEHDRCASWNRNRLCPTLGVCSPTKLRCGSKSGSDQDKLVHALAGLSGAQSYMLESYVVYKDHLRQYCKLSKVYRTE